MSLINELFSKYSGEISPATILFILANIAILSFYEFYIYRNTSHKAFYSKAFGICIVTIPFLLGTIIMSLQTNYYLALGTIGVLAIIRFRTAIKDPVEMVYLLWSIHTGIMCGCQLFAISYVTSAVITAVIIAMEKTSSSKGQYILTIHSEIYDENLSLQLETLCKTLEIKSRQKTENGIDLVIELKCKNINAFEKKLNQLDIRNYSIIECSNGDILW